MRQAVHGKLRAGLLVAALLAFLALTTGLLALLNARQQRLNAQLIAAVRACDDRRAIALLKQGASPNAPAGPPVRVPFWRLVLQSLKGWRRPPSGPTILSVALQHFLNDSSPARLYSSYRTIRALKLAGGQTPGDPAVAASQMAAQLPGPNAGRETDHGLRLSSFDSDDGWSPVFTIRDVVEKFGPSAAAFAWMGSYRLERAQYRWAAMALRLALLWAPRSAAVQQGLQQALLRQRIWMKVTPLIPRQDRVLRLIPIPSNRAGFTWAAAFGRAPNDGWSDAGEKDHLRVAVFHSAGGSLRMAWMSPDLWEQQLGPSETLRGIHLRVSTDPVEGTPVLMAQLEGYGGSWFPCELQAFALRPAGVQRVLRLDSSDSLFQVESGPQAPVTVGNEFEIGVEESHAGQPRWSDLYSFRDGRFALADRKHPGFFVHWFSELSAVLSRYPTDYEIQRYLGETYVITGHPEQARRTYLQAIRAINGSLRHPPGPWFDPSWARAYLPVLRRCLQTLPDVPPGSRP